MKKLLLLFVMFFGLLSISEAHAQLPHCCKNKVRIRKQRKRAPGALVGVKGKDDSKSLRKGEKARAKAFKEAERKKKLAAKEKEKGLEKAEDTTVVVKKDKKSKKPKTKSEQVDDLLKIFDNEQKNLEEE